MAATTETNFEYSDNMANEFADNMAKASDIWQHIIQRMALGAMESSSPNFGHADPLHIQRLFFECAEKWIENPQAVQDAQVSLWQKHLQLWQDTTHRLLGKPAEDTDIHDRRFKDDAWNNNAFFDYLRRSYLINSQWAEESINNLEGIDPQTKEKLRFYTKQWVDAVAPSNFMLTNPQVIKETLEQKGANLVHGLENMLEDIEKNKGQWRISMTDEEAFHLGENIANTPGSVVFENDLMQLIQYEPATEKVHKTPLLFIPAWINKYYILDLREENSLIRWAVEKGYTVFVISWVNPDETLGRKSFEHYMLEGPLTALDVIEDITGSHQTSLIGYCLGGTLTACLLAYLHAHGEEERIASVSYLTTMIVFSEAGDLSVFIDEEQIDSLEERMHERGYLDSNAMAMTFNMLRANDLIWSFFVNNYLLGKDPFPFDLLYWNSDSTRMPAAMHSFYLRQMYQKNKLIDPDGIVLLDTPINIHDIQTPSYILSTKDDHIAPWRSTYAATQIYDGETEFVLSESGHVAGVINPPHKKKYGYWHAKKCLQTPEKWLEKADYVKDSWWNHWLKWNKRFAGNMVKARSVGNKNYPPIEKAPGAYARVKGNIL